MYDDHPKFQQPPNLDAKIWRYVDFTKFVSMLDFRSLHFARQDSLQDKYEGSWSAATLRLFQKAVESAAMWKVYLKSDEGVALQSTVRRLRDCFDKDPTVLVYVGLVQYADYDKEQIRWDNFLMPLLYKRASFKYEQELRAVAMKSAVSDENSSPHLTREYFSPGATPIRVDLDRLIERVYVAPTNEAWFGDLVRRMLERYQLNKEVFPSSLADGPLY